MLSMRFLLADRRNILRTTIALVVVVLGFGVVANGQNSTTPISIIAREIVADGQGRGFTIRIGDVAILSADRFELEQPASIRLLDNVQLGVDPLKTSTGLFVVKVPSSGAVTLRLLDVVITADGAEPDHDLGVLRLLGDVRIRQERPETIRQ
jgi:hypothetical protein